MRKHNLRVVYLTVGLANLAVMGGFALNLAGLITPESSSLLMVSAVGEFDLQSGEPVFDTWYSASLLVAVAVVATINYLLARPSASAGRASLGSSRSRWRFGELPCFCSLRSSTLSHS